jgi:hypothetical protein
MNEFEQARSFGLITIPHGLCFFYVHIDKYNFISVETSGYPVKAMWQGDQIIVEMSHGDIRVYSALSSSAYYIVSK